MGEFFNTSIYGLLVRFRGPPELGGSDVGLPDLRALPECPGFMNPSPVNINSLPGDIILVNPN